MKHFAYPNVVTREKRFIGCGRYIVVSPRCRADERYSRANPDIPNKTDINEAAIRLAPDSESAESEIYETRDPSPVKYKGESQDLAYFLSLVSRSRNLNGRKKDGGGDIWCTGEIKLQFERQPSLVAVNSGGFQLKLEAFLEDENTDSLFLVPAANIEHHHTAYVQEKGGKIVSLSDVKLLKDALAGGNKCIVKVRTDELKKLIEVLFQKPKKKIQTYVQILIAVLFASMVFYAGHNFFSDRTGMDDILRMLENGQYETAHRIVQDSSSQFSELSTLMSTPFKMDVFFQYQMPGTEFSAPLTVSDPHLRSLELSHRDNYSLHLSSDTPVKLFIYIFQIDYKGHLDRIFPNPIWVKTISNPASPDQFPIIIPDDTQKSFYLDELDSTHIVRLPDERIYIVASPWRSGDLENIYADIQAETNRDLRNDMMKRFMKMLAERKNTSLPSVIYHEIIFRHGL